MCAGPCHSLARHAQPYPLPPVCVMHPNGWMRQCSGMSHEDDSVDTVGVLDQEVRSSMSV